MCETSRAIDAVKTDGYPYGPPDEGDLLDALVRANGYRRCLETGFYTGSTALCMAAATADREGEIDDGDCIEASRLRLFHILTRRSPRRPYKALTKIRDSATQTPLADPKFFRRL